MISTISSPEPAFFRSAPRTRALFRVRVLGADHKESGLWERDCYVNNDNHSILMSSLNTSLGMNAKHFKYRWGGEDWDLLDRVLMLPVEVERIKHPGLYHHYHAKTRQWN